MIVFELIHNRSVLTVFVASCCLNVTTDLFEPDGKFRVEVIAFSEGSRKDDGQWLLKIRLGSTSVIENAGPTVMRNCPRDEGGPFELSNQAVNQFTAAAMVKSHGGERYW